MRIVLLGLYLGSNLSVGQRLLRERSSYYTRPHGAQTGTKREQTNTIEEIHASSTYSSTPLKVSILISFLGTRDQHEDKGRNNKKRIGSDGLNKIKSGSGNQRERMKAQYDCSSESLFAVCRESVGEKRGTTKMSEIKVRVVIRAIERVKK